MVDWAAVAMNDALPYAAVMVAALKLPPHAMTVAAFLDWNPDDGSGGLWQLRDGEPESLAAGVVSGRGNG